MAIRVAVLFGGRAPEHEVSIITGIQVLNSLKGSSYTPIPIYVTKNGQWVLGDDSFFNPETFKDEKIAIKGKKIIYLLPDPGEKKVISKHKMLSSFSQVKDLSIDVYFPAFHGRYGEDGAIQGLFEIANATYVGCDVQSSAIGMDKVVSKRVAQAVNVPVLEDVVVDKADWNGSKRKIVLDIKSKLGSNVFVKPARLGSSIGITRVDDIKDLEDALEVAFCYDNKVLVEKTLLSAKEINVSILGNDPYELSVCEEPLSAGDILSFEDKYISKGDKPSKGMATAKRVVPAKIKKTTEKKIKSYTEAVFKEIGGQGVARVDYLVKKNESSIYFNEINTMPGSISFYLWKETGVNFKKLSSKLVKLALERKKEKDKLISTFKSNILEGFDRSKAAKF